MNSDTASIRLCGVCKSYRLEGPRKGSRTQALTDIDLEIGGGECVAVLGLNGAGKSTLLRLVAGVTEPDIGEVECRGRVAPILRLGVGFSPLLTGRENAHLSASLLGLSRPAIEQAMTGISEFSQLGDWLEQPMRLYSRGMRTRLAFATAIAVDADIFLLDEGLATGDADFKTKCREALKAKIGQGKTWLIATHNLGDVKELCQRAILLEQGRIVARGPVEQILEVYRERRA